MSRRIPTPRPNTLTSLNDFQQREPTLEDKIGRSLKSQGYTPDEIQETLTYINNLKPEK